MGDDLGVGEAAHFDADRLEGLVEPGIADRALVRSRRFGPRARARFSTVLPVAISSATAPSRSGAMRFRQAEIGEADDLALVHRDAAENLREIFAQADAGQQLLGLAEAAFLRIRRA